MVVLLQRRLASSSCSLPFSSPTPLPPPPPVASLSVWRRQWRQRAPRYGRATSSAARRGPAASWRWAVPGIGHATSPPRGCRYLLNPTLRCTMWPSIVTSLAAPTLILLPPLPSWPYCAAGARGGERHHRLLPPVVRGCDCGRHQGVHLPVRLSCNDTRIRLFVVCMRLAAGAHHETAAAGACVDFMVNA